MLCAFHAIKCEIFTSTRSHYVTDGYEQGMMMENGLSPDYDDPAIYGNENSEYMMAAHYAQGG